MNSYLGEDSAIAVLNKFAANEEDWSLTFNHNGYPVVIRYDAATISTYIVVGDSYTDMYLAFPFKYDGRGIGNMIENAKVCIDEFVKDYEKEEGVLN